MKWTKSSEQSDFDQISAKIPRSGTESVRVYKSLFNSLQIPGNFLFSPHISDTDSLLKYLKILYILHEGCATVTLNMSISIISGLQAEIRAEVWGWGGGGDWSACAQSIVRADPSQSAHDFSSPLFSNRLKCKTLLKTKSNNAKFIADISEFISSFSCKTGF